MYIASAPYRDDRCDNSKPGAIDAFRHRRESALSKDQLVPASAWRKRAHFPEWQPLAVCIHMRASVQLQGRLIGTTWRHAPPWEVRIPLLWWQWKQKGGSKDSSKGEVCIEVCLEFCSDSSKGSKKGMSMGSNKGTIRVTIHPYPVYTYYYVPRTKCCINVAGNRFSNATCKSVKLRQFSNSICSLEPNPRNMSASSRRSEIIGGLVCSGKLPQWFLVKTCPRPFYG